MKPIGPSRKQLPIDSKRNTPSSTRNDVQVARPVLDSPKRKTETQYHEAATPNKKRRVEVMPASPSRLPKLSFNFASSGKSVSTNIPNIYPTVFRQTLPNQESSLTTTVENDDGSTETNSKTTFAETKESLKRQESPQKTRDEKRLEQRKKATIQRMKQKSSTGRPGWK